MMGHVMNLLVQFVEEEGGAAAADALFVESGVEREDFRFERVYPEEDFGKLAGATMKVLELELPELEARFAKFFMRVSPELFPAIFKLAGDAQSLLSRIPHLHRSLPSAASRTEFRDKLTVESDEPGCLVLRYDSPHKLCGFLMHLSRLALEHYGQRGEIRELECSRQGQAACLVRIDFEGTA